MLPSNVFSPYDWIDLWHRAVAVPSLRFALAGTLLDDREVAPPALPFVSALFPQALEARRASSATFKLLRRLTKTSEKPAFAIEQVEVDGAQRPVVETEVDTVPFARLLQFDVEGREDAPQVLLVAPMAGHYATLLRETVREFVATHRVFVTDWSNARDVPLADGGFDMDDYIDQLIAWFERLGGEVHAVGVCQAGVPLLAAVALMEADDTLRPSLPCSIVVMGSPIDTGRSPTEVNAFATKNDIGWFSQSLIAIVPSAYPGANRAVYPGYLQLSAFLAMNPERHEKSARDAIRHFADGDFTSAEKIDSFYGEFLSVMDLTAEFYIQTVERVFQRNQLAHGTFQSRGRPVRLDAIERTPILAIEGEKDDITGLGQTRAALDLTPKLSPAKKQYLMLEESGHYGLFSGSRFRSKVAPEIRQFQATAGGGEITRVA